MKIRYGVLAAPILVIASCGPTPGSSAEGPRCQNGLREDGEECDRLDLGGATCQSLGYESGTLVCRTSCVFDKTGCSGSSGGACGNGVADGSEQCDRADLKGATCESLNLGTGTLACSPGCAHDTTGCRKESGVTVTVKEGGLAKPAAYVAMHQQDGTFVAEGKTDSSGTYVFRNAPVGVQITIGISRSSTTRVTRTYVGVDQDGKIVWERPADTSTTPVGVGTMSSTFPGAVSGATTYAATNGCQQTSTSNGSGAITLVTTTSCVDGTNTGLLYAEARSGTGEPLAWTVAQNVTVNGTTNVVLPAWTSTFDTLTTSLTNAPGGVDLVQRISGTAGRVSLSPFPTSVASTTAGSTYTHTAKLPTGLTSSAGATVVLAAGEQLCSERRAPPYAPFAFAGAELPARITAYAVNTTNVERPSATFTVAAGGAAGDATTWTYFAQGGGVSHTWEVVAPGNATGPFVIPQLPNSADAAPFRLTGTTPVFGSDRVTKTEDADITGYPGVLGGFSGGRRFCLSQKFQ